MTDTIEPNSSFISKAAYDTESKVLGILFQNGSEWQYQGVPETVWMQFKNSPSKGTMFHQHIKEQYAGTQV